MKVLWVARLARPDLMKATTDLASAVSKWSANDDKKAYRLICYMHHTADLQLVGHVADPASDVKLTLWVDADFGGDRLNALSLIHI